MEEPISIAPRTLDDLLENLRRARLENLANPTAENKAKMKIAQEELSRRLGPIKNLGY